MLAIKSYLDDLEQVFRDTIVFFSEGIPPKYRAMGAVEILFHTDRSVPLSISHVYLKRALWNSHLDSRADNLFVLFR